MKWVFLLAAAGVFCAPCCNATVKEAFFKNPVTDLTSKPLSKCGILSGFVKTYSPENNGCIRTMQGLYGEQFDVIEEDETADHVCVELSHCFYLLDGVQKSSYWAKRDDIIFVDDIKEKNNDFVLPDPITYTNPSSMDLNTVATLCEPWVDSETKTTYSAGTRFSTFSKQAIEGKGLPLLKSEMLKDGLGRRAAFVALLKKWAENEQGIIPYVWGGGSYTVRVAKQGFVQKIDLKKDGEKEVKVGYWARPDIQGDPSGFDCSMLLLRAAQLCKIKYFCRTTATIPSVLTEMGKDAQICPGDILWVNGHVMAFSDDDSMIAAESYSPGYGSVCKTPIFKRFKGLSTCNDLAKLYAEKGLLTFLSAKGEASKPREFKIFKLPV
ncbi:TPA: hypothetical protein DDZ86_00660 [Candidatus Dependentiae bacterium]|nr:hypothetical protein [Candidatus Dependentiae bacterium]